MFKNIETDDQEISRITTNLCKLFLDVYTAVLISIHYAIIINVAPQYICKHLNFEFQK